MTTPSDPKKPRKRRRGRGDHGITWDKVNRTYVGSVSRGYQTDGKRFRPTVRGRTKAEVKDRLDDLQEELRAGARPRRTPSSSA